MSSTEQGLVKTLALGVMPGATFIFGRLKLAKIIMHSIAYVSSVVMGVEFDSDYRATGENKIVAMAGIFY